MIDLPVVINKKDGEGTVRQERIAIVRTVAYDGLGKDFELG